jgi:hypothetical protein
LQSFSIDNVGTTGYVELSTSQKICDIGVSTDLAPEKFKRTKIVRFSSRYVVVNRSEQKILIRQQNSPFNIELDVEQ